MKRMNLKKVLHNIYGFAAAFIVLILLAAVLKSILVMALGLLCAIAGIAVNLAFWRCPYCGEHLGRDGGKYCSHCGHHLVDLE